MIVIISLFGNPSTSCEIECDSGVVGVEVVVGTTTTDDRLLIVFFLEDNQTLIHVVFHVDSHSVH